MLVSLWMQFWTFQIFIFSIYHEVITILVVTTQWQLICTLWPYMWDWFPCQINITESRVTENTIQIIHLDPKSNRQILTCKHLDAARILLDLHGPRFASNMDFRAPICAQVWQQFMPAWYSHGFPFCLKGPNLIKSPRQLKTHWVHWTVLDLVSSQSISRWI